MPPASTVTIGLPLIVPALIASDVIPVAALTASAGPEIVPPSTITPGYFMAVPEAIASVAPVSTVTADKARALGFETARVPAETVVEPV